MTDSAVTHCSIELHSQSSHTVAMDTRFRTNDDQYVYNEINSHNNINHNLAGKYHIF